MAEEQTGQEPAETPEGQEPGGGKQETFDAAYVKQLRDEAASWRRKVKDLEGKVTNFEAEKMTEAEQLKARAETAAKEAEEARAALRKARAEAAISRAATKSGADPDLIAGLVQVDFDDDGNPKGVDAAITDLLTKYPYLKANAVSLSSTNPQRKPTLTRADVERMTPQQINERWDEVQEVMRAGK